LIGDTPEIVPLFSVTDVFENAPPIGSGATVPKLTRN